MTMTKMMSKVCNTFFTNAHFECYGCIELWMVTWLLFSFFLLRLIIYHLFQLDFHT